MTISAPLRPGIPNGDAAGPVRNETMPSLTGAADAAGCCACAGITDATATAASASEVLEWFDIGLLPPLTSPVWRTFLPTIVTLANAIQSLVSTAIFVLMQRPARARMTAGALRMCERSGGG